MLTLDGLLAALTSGDETRAEAAVPDLVEFGQEAFPALRELLASKDADHRWWALRTLAQSPQVRSVGVAYVILPLFGFVAKEGVVNTADALWGLKACYLLPPVICVMIGGLAMWGYRLDEKRHTEIRLALSAREAAHGASVAGVAQPG